MGLAPKNLDLAIRRMSQDLWMNAGVEQKKGRQKEQLAILAFTDLKGDSGDFGNYLSEQLTTELHRSNRFEVIERSRLDKILEEHKLALSGVIDPKTAKKIGKVTGAEWIVIGTYANMGRAVDFNGRFVDVETGKVRAASRVRIKLDEKVAKLLNVELPQEPYPQTPPDPSNATRARAPRPEDGYWVFEYDSPTAGTVYLSGDFNQWANPYDAHGRRHSLPMDRDSEGLWRAWIPLSSGIYNYMFIADGQWVLDPANPNAAEDGAGGWVSYVQVP